jgi:hypothetical protein
MVVVTMKVPTVQYSKRQFWQVGSWVLLLMGVFSLLGLLVGLGVRMADFWNGRLEPEWISVVVLLGFCGLWIVPALWVWLGLLTQQLEPRPAYLHHSS